MSTLHCYANCKQPIITNRCVLQSQFDRPNALRKTFMVHSCTQWAIGKNELPNKMLSKHYLHKLLSLEEEAGRLYLIWYTCQCANKENVNIANYYKCIWSEATQTNHSLAHNFGCTSSTIYVRPVTKMSVLHFGDMKIFAKQILWF